MPADPEPQQQCIAILTGSPHREEFRHSFLGRVSQRMFGTHMHSFATQINTRVAPDGQFQEGALFEVAPEMPLAQARPLLGATLSGRIGVYDLRGEPAGHNTAMKVNASIRDRRVADEIDNHGEAYGPYSMQRAADTPWTPQLNNGHARDSFVSLARSEHGPARYVVLVHSNATPQANEAIDAALAANPAATVGEFARSVACARLAAMSDLQNKRIADRFAVQLGISAQLNTRHHPTEVTSDDAYAAPVRYAEPTSIVRYGELRPAASGDVRISNRALDLTATEGHAVPLVHSPLHGFSLLTATRAEGVSALAGCLRPLRSKTLDSIAAGPREVANNTEMGADEMEQLNLRLHWPNKDELSATQVAARLGAVDARKTAFTAEALNNAGLSHLTPTEFKVLGSVVFA